MAIGLPPNWDFSLQRPAEPKGEPICGYKGRTVYIVMCGDVIEGVYTDMNRARDCCVRVVRAQVEEIMAPLIKYDFQTRSQGAVEWPLIRPALIGDDAS